MLLRCLFFLPLAALANTALPVSFEANHGQFESAVRFAAPGLLLSPAQARLSLPGQTPVTMQFAGANPAARMFPLDSLPAVSNYILGPDPRHWRTNVPHFARVKSTNIYPGIDIVYYSKNNHLEFDFLLAPQADPNLIRLQFRGASPKLDPSGDLLLGATRLRAPVAYQGNKTIAARFTLHANKTIGFTLAPYDKSKPLVIDPVLAYSTFLTAANAIGSGIALDAAGNTYLTGNTNNTLLTVNGIQPAFGAGRAAFVAKLNPAGTALVYATYLGGTSGNSSTAGLRIAVDRAGAAYVVGHTSSTSFPVTAGTAQPTNRGGDDLFVAKLNPAGNALMYASYLGGSGDENTQSGIPSIAVDSDGNAYISGGTSSRDFRVTQGAAQATYGGGAADAFVTKLDPLGSTIVYSTFIGGANTDVSNAIAVDAAGNAYIAGASGPKALLAKLNPAGSALLYSNSFGGTNGDVAFSLAVDNASNAYLTGLTGSADFPVTAQAFQKSAPGGNAFVTKFNATGLTPVYSTLIGGAKDDVAYHIAIDALGNAVITGATESTDFPVTPDAFQSGPGLVYRGGGRTAPGAFLTKLNASGSALAYSTYFGGSKNEAATAVALDAAGNAYITGVSSSINFPRTMATYEPPDRAEFSTAFLARFDLASRSSMSLGSVISAATYQPGTTGVVAPGQIVTLFGNELGPAQLTTLQLTADGRVDTALAGVRVFFDNTPAPLLYVSAKQLSAVVPYNVPINGRTTVQVDYQGQRSNPLVLWTAPAMVGVFTQNSSGRGPGAIINQDGTINSPSNPADRGSIITLFATGEGRTTPEGVDGKVAAAPLPRPVLRIFALISDRATEVLYAGAAPGLVSGVLQMNIRVPETTIPGPAVPIRIGGMDGPFGVEPSEWVTIAIR